MAPSLESLKNISTRLHHFRRNRRGHDSAEKKSSQRLDQASTSAMTSRSGGLTQPKKALDVSVDSATTFSQKASSLSKSSEQNVPETSSLFLQPSISSTGNTMSYGKAPEGNSFSNPGEPLGSQYNTPFQTYESFPFYVHTGTSSQDTHMSTNVHSNPPLCHSSIFSNPPLVPGAYSTVSPGQIFPHPGLAWNFAGYPPSHGLSTNSQVSYLNPFEKMKSHLPVGTHNTLADITQAPWESNPLFPNMQSSHTPEESNSSESKPIDPELPEDTAGIDLALEDLKPLRQFVQGFLSWSCSKCAKTKPLDPKDVVKMTIGWVRSTDKIVLGAACPNVFCTASTCLGCGKPISFATNNTLKIPEMNATVYWCCDSGRLAAIWALSCGWDASTCKSQARSCVANKVRGRTNSSTHTMQSSHPSAYARGVGYGSNRLESFPFQYFRSQAPTRVAPKNATDTQEHLLRRAYFRLLAALLPSGKRNGALDASPPDFLLHILSRSPLIDKVAMMLSNDSIEDISHQYQLYDSMLDLFDVLGSHHSTSGLVYNDRNLYHAKGGSLLEVSIGPVQRNSRIVVRDTGKPLIALLGNLATQSQTVLRHAQSNHTEFHNREGVELLKLSERLSQISTQHTANMQRFRISMEITDDNPEINFSEWHRENCVKDAPDETIMQDFAYVRDAALGGMFTTNPTRGRMKRLITELSTLQTSLPEGIFIYHGSSRLDIIKVLIIGPKHTPYEHGLFEFDLWCPIDYPNSPPKMKFRTTNGGRTRFNPNLYEDGKICLSLLGTWSGEPWRPYQSTLLQVLVSIQSMILCEQPWYNEPGREDYVNKALSAKYNNDVRTWTMQYALLPWINATDTQDATSTTATSFWKETAQLYLRANAKDILNSSKEASLKSNKSALQTAAMRIGTSLQEKGYLD